jgi:uncharacterized protein YegJ (DUF2314 family)
MRALLTCAKGLVLVLSLVACSRSKAAGEQKDEVLYVKGSDPAMSAAIANAQATLDNFRGALAAPPAGTQSFSVKVGFAWGTKGEREHIWLTEPKFDGASVSGKINNDPVDVTTLTLGQAVTAPVKDVSDWMYVDNGVLRGGYTLRVLLDKMSPEARKKMLDEMGFRLE